MQIPRSGRPTASRPVDTLLAISLTLSAWCVMPPRASAQDMFDRCPKIGSAKPSSVKALNERKNRDKAPQADQIDQTVTLGKMLVRGDDENRWDEDKAVDIEGYVYDVKPG